MPDSVNIMSTSDKPEKRYLLNLLPVIGTNASRHCEQGPKRVRAGMNTTNSTNEETGSRDPLHGISAALLRSEIGFWQDLIESSKGPLASGALERMEQALALAQSRLQRLLQNSQQPAANVNLPHSNVYSITGRQAGTS